MEEGTDESRREKNSFDRRNTIGIGGELEDSASKPRLVAKRPRTVEKRQARTIVRRWREIGGLTTAKIE